MTEKHSEKGGDSRLMFGASAMQGWRISMEDAHTAILDLDPATPASQRHPTGSDGEVEVENEAEKAKRAFGGTGESGVTVGEKTEKGEGKYSFFAVYDGHGGQAVAIQSGARLHWKIVETEEFGKVRAKRGMDKGTER